MDLNDLYYRGFTQYVKQLEKEKDAIKLRRIIKSSNLENDKLQTVRLVCNIDEEWVKNIEEGLVYVEKAIREERQFIRVEGEVVPIEKAKHTSKTTVEHLAKHSNFITHLPEKPGDDLVPDKLYIVEKESDYAVYENRFLFMMLTYLKDFLAIRLNRIRDKMTTYHGKYIMNKDISLADRKLHYEINLSDEIKDDPILLEKYKSIKIIDRIDMQYHLVLALLDMPLMQQVSKAPMLKPPIIKTNTLKMNTNFKTSLALYDYIAAYNQPGYSFEEETVELAPLTDDVSEDYANAIALNAFLTYKNTNGISKELKAKALEYENLAREEESKKHLEQLQRLRRHMRESNQDFEEYLIILENYNRELEKQTNTIPNLKKVIEELNQELNREQEEIKSLRNNVETLENEITSKVNEIMFLTEKGASDLLVMEQLHRKQVEELIASHEAEIERLKAEHAAEIERLNAEHAAEIENINNEHVSEVEGIKNAYEEKIVIINNEALEEKQRAIEEATTDLLDKIQKNDEKHQKEVDSLNNELLEINNTLNRKKKEYQASLKEKDDKVSQTLDEKKRMIVDYEDKIFNLMKDHREKCSEYEKEINDKVKEIKQINKENQKQCEFYEKRIDYLNKQKLFVDAQLHAIRLEQGKETDEYDYTSKERFLELEGEYQAFKQLFKKEWKKTKEKIREDYLKNNKLDEEDLAKEEEKKNKKKKSEEKENQITSDDSLENNEPEEDFLESNDDSSIEEEDKTLNNTENEEVETQEEPEE